MGWKAHAHTHTHTHGQDVTPKTNCSQDGKKGTEITLGQNVTKGQNATGDERR
jgi:hypothetical protein